MTPHSNGVSNKLQIKQFSSTERTAVRQRKGMLAAVIHRGGESSDRPIYITTR